MYEVEASKDSPVNLIKSPAVAALPTVLSIASDKPVPIERVRLPTVEAIALNAPPIALAIRLPLNTDPLIDEPRELNAALVLSSARSVVMTLFTAIAILRYKTSALVLGVCLIPRARSPQLKMA